MISAKKLINKMNKQASIQNILMPDTFEVKRRENKNNSIFAFTHKHDKQRCQEACIHIRTIPSKIILNAQQADVPMRKSISAYITEVLGIHGDFHHVYLFA